MAITRVERLRGLEASYGVNSSEYDDTYRIYTDSDMSRLQIVESAWASGKLPKIFTAHEEYGVIDTQSYLQRVKLRQLDQDKRTWTASCEFRPMPSNSTTSDHVTSPLELPVRHWLEWIEENGVVVKDKDGKPITNSIGDEFDTAIEMPHLFPVLVYEKPYATVDELISLGTAYHRTVNSLTFRGGSPRTVKFLPIQSSPVQTMNGQTYFMAQLRFAYNPETWDYEILNRGWRYKPAADKPLEKAVDKQTRLPVSSPVNLALDGTLLSDTAEKVYVKKQLLKPVDYNAIFAP